MYILKLMNEESEITVVLPCLNEAETLATCILKAQSSFSRMGLSGEVLVADNGSTDGSQDIAKEHGARVINVPIKGYGSALLAGFRNSHGKFVIMADADDSYSLDVLEPFVSELRLGADLVMGNRFAGTIHEGAMPWLHRYVGNPILSFIGRLFFRSKVRDFHCGMRGLNKQRILELGLYTTGMEFASELIVKAILANYKIVEVSTDLKPDGRNRAPHLNTWRDGWRHLRFLLSFSPRWLFFYPGISLASLGFLGFSFLATGKREVIGINFDLQTLVFFTFAMLCGTQMIWFAVLAKASSLTKKFMPLDKKWKKILSYSENERIYVFYFILVIFGIIILGMQIVNWASSSFGELNVSYSVRKSLIGGSLLFLGLQSLISHFLLHIITMGSSRDFKT